MKKQTFIPKSYRPQVPGSKLLKISLESYKISFLPERTDISSILIISAKGDIVPKSFLKEISSESPILHLFYDNLGLEWDFSFFDGILKIHLKNNIILPISIYQRHPGIFKDHIFYQKHIAFFEVLDIWQGNLMGQKRDHFHNASKAYQGITSILNAGRTTENHRTKYPRSFFLKGNYKILKNKFKGPLVVKSCSNIRSKVVSDDVYCNWNTENLKYLPTFFQEKISGKDIRVHICGKNILL